MVKSTLVPTRTEPLLAVFETPISACETMVVQSDAESFAVLTSPPPATVAGLVSGLVADWATAATTAMAGYDPPAASASARVQVTSWPAMLRLQPVPEAVDGVSPAGSVSETVTSPLVGTGEMLFTTR